MNTTLNALHVGDHGYVSEITARPAMLRRLTDLGLVPGTRVECELLSPSGDPAAYRIRGALIALRRQDAEQVRVVSGAPAEGEAEG